MIQKSIPLYYPDFRDPRLGHGLGRPSSSVKLDIFIENKGFRERKLTLKGEKHKEKEMYLIKSWNSNQGWFSIGHQVASRMDHLIKGSTDQIHFIFEINVGKSRIRHRKTLNFELRHSIGVDLEIDHSISESLYVGSDSFQL